MPGNDDDGHGIVEETVDEAFDESFKGARLDLKKLRRDDGILTRPGPGGQSLLHRVISAIGDNKDYRQELKIALFNSSDEADNAVAALEECSELGMNSTPIIDQIIARSSGRNHDLLFEVLRTLTHTTFTTNYQKGQKSERRRAGPMS